MKNILLIITGTLCLISCDKRKDFFTEKNQPIYTHINLTNPHSHISSTMNGYNIVDTLKLGFDYTFEINLTDESLIIPTFTGAGELFMTTHTSPNSYISFNDLSSNTSIPSGTYKFRWETIQLGINEFSISFKDVYEVVTTYNFRIYVFDNIAPYTWWEVVHDGSLDSLHKKVIIHGNDGDALYGGHILYYQIVIGTDTTNYPDSQMNYIFPQEGVYLISLRALDSNNQWGNTSTMNNVLIEKE